MWPAAAHSLELSDVPPFDDMPAPAGIAPAEGDFVGTGVWTLVQHGEVVDVQYDWRIRADKPLLRYGTFVMRPIFSANHRWAMARGEESLKLELQRRHAKTEAVW